MIDPCPSGKPGRTVTAEIEKGRLRFFAKAIGETDPVYADEAAARAAGHPALPVPPTYLFCAEMTEQREPVAWLADIGVNLLHILHGEQRFDYHAMAYAGDTLTFESRISDIFQRKGGALDFVVKDTRVTNQHGIHVADLRSTVVQRVPAAGR